MTHSNKINYELHPIGFIRSKITRRADAPLFYDEGAPNAVLELLPQFTEGVSGLKAGDEIIVITWLHQGDRNILQVHPRGNKSNPLTGVFRTRSPDRPNPIGLHRAKIVKIDAHKIFLNVIEVIDGTPVVDLKPVMLLADD